MDDPAIFSRLLVRPLPVPAEDQRGFWLRLAHDNGLKRPQWLLSSGGRWPTGIVRVCTECLRATGAYWRQEWQRRDSFWCLQHEQWLLDTCPSCQRRLRWNNVRFQNCVCSFDLREAAIMAVDPRIVAAVSARTAPMDVLRTFGAFAMHGPQGKVGKKANRTTVDEARAQLEAGIVVVSGWPAKFTELLDGFRTPVAADGVVQLLHEALPGLGEFAALISDVEWHKRVASAIDGYCVRTLSGGAPIVGRNAVLSSGPLTLKEVAVRLGRSTTKVAQVIDSQGSTIRGLRVTANGRRRRVVGDGDVQIIATLLDESVAVKHAARLLALPASRVRALVQAGALSPQGDRLRRSDVAALTRVSADRPIVSGIDGPNLQLRLALRNWIQAGETAEFLRAVRAGELSVVEATRELRLGLWRVSLAQVRAWVAIERNSDASVLTLSQAASLMSLKHDVLLDLVRSGLLRAAKGSRGGRQGWQISAADLAAFQAKYVPLARMTAEARVRSRDGFAWARAQGLRLACGPQVDGSRQYFVDRSKALSDAH